MGRGEEDLQLKAAKRGYREASADGNREEEARFANVIGDMYKKRGEYVEAIRWLQIDYKISTKFLPQKQILPTCQSLGEVYFLLGRFQDALVYQKKHLELAKETDDLIEQQRASTQLGRTYHEIFLGSEDDHCAMQTAKKYYKSAMKKAKVLKERNTSFNCSSFLKEFIDAQNNIGLLELDLDNPEEAERILLDGLKNCNDEEINENDEVRTRLHHNLGRLYLELRQWRKSREHIEKDIQICKRIGHQQGESKGFINLGEMYYRTQMYNEAVNCYRKALDIAYSMIDEHALVNQITDNIEIVNKAVHVQEEINKEEQKLKKLAREACSTKGSSRERKYLLEQNSSLDNLIQKTIMISAWKKNLEFAKRKKRVVSELRDKEKLGDSYHGIAESYYNLRNFSKARKWFMKCWNTYRSIGNLEGQAMAKIDMGRTSDSCGDWAGALQAFEEGYRIAVEAKLPFLKLSALNNMHYSHMIRFDNNEDARKLQHEIKNMRHFFNEEEKLKNLGNDHCSETETEEFGRSYNASSETNSSDACKADHDTSKPTTSYIISPNRKMAASHDHLNKSPVCQTSSRKRIRIFLSDDESDDPCDQDQTRRRLSEGNLVRDAPTNLDDIPKDAVFSNVPRDVLSTCTPIDIEGSTCSSKSKMHKASPVKNMEFESMGESIMDVHHASGNLLKKQNELIFTCKIGSDLIRLDTKSCMDSGKLSNEYMKVEIARLYYLNLTKEKRSKALLPVLQKLKINGMDLSLSEPIASFDTSLLVNGWIDIIVDEWVPKRMMKLYIDYCGKKSEIPNFKLLKKLYDLEVSEDEIIASDCGLQDVSISPFIDALCEHRTVAILDVSHNALGNVTMERLQEMFTSSTQTYGSLILDFHCNRFGPTSLFQICECPVLFTRLEVLNLSENRLTDACSSYLSTILMNCKALYSLSIEQCCITSRTIQRIADVLQEGHALSQLKIGKNSPLSGNSMVNLLGKLTKLTSFSELSMTGIKLNNSIIESLCQLVRSANMSNLMLGSTNMGDDGATQVIKALFDGPQELVKLDLSSCRLNMNFTQLCANIELIDGILELNFGGNPLGKENCPAISSLLANPKCSLKVIVLNNCRLGLSGIFYIIQALKENKTLEEIHVANNVDLTQEESLQCDDDMEVPDSEDDDELTKTDRVSSVSDGNRASSTIEELSVVFASSANQLRYLDLSCNGLSKENVETLYNAWSSRYGLSARKHVEEKTVHFSVDDDDGKKCCDIKPCCRRD
ncbi:Protein TONSOKU [Zostera marina]|uniref:Protein TONSOKU n=1 Tax=Zostera marina TaxID=29655 RepID=A0A0K9NLI9_ZOSMR|nr:Protein TONSOKU [Zostera marina]